MIANTNKFHWGEGFERNTMYLSGEKVAEIVPEDHYGTIMWRVTFPDKTKSKDVYNRDWAKEHAARESLRILNEHSTVTDALK